MNSPNIPIVEPSVVEHSVVDPNRVEPDGPIAPLAPPGDSPELAVPSAPRSSEATLGADVISSLQ